jgi:uncharacterized protein YuzB (UPF0349 family)
MNNKIKICNNCKKINLEQLIKVIKELDSNIEINIGCQKFCGICSKKAFVILNNIPIIEDEMDNLIIKIKDKIKR